MSDSDGFLDDVDDDEDDENDVIESDIGVVEESDDLDGIDTPEHTNTLLRPASEDLQEIKQVYDQFETMKTELLTKDDMQDISGNMFITKSGWRKIATAFNITVESTSEQKVVEDGVVRWKIKARAVAPNGKVATGLGMAGSNESNFMERADDQNADYSNQPDMLHVDGQWRRLKDPREINEHNLYATAETRAKNRAISDLVGGGQVSAEELTADHYL